MEVEITHRLARNASLPVPAIVQSPYIPFIPLKIKPAKKRRKK